MLLSVGVCKSIYMYLQDSMQLKVDYVSVVL